MNKEQNEDRVTITQNGIETSVLNLLPTINSQEIAVVDYGVLLRLASYLPKASIWDIKRELESKISDVTDIENYVAVLEEELAFHKTVNVINTVGKEDVHMLEGKIDLGSQSRPVVQTPSDEAEM